MSKFTITGRSGQDTRTITFHKPEVCKYFRVTQSPFFNCQVFALGGINKIVHLNKDELKKLLSMARKATGKRLMVCDVSNKYHKEVIKKLKIHCTKVSKRKYVSTNGSIMHMLMCYLDKGKLS